MARRLKTVKKAIVDINVTPMVDVMLVLLIIFMVITPMLSKGVSVDMVRTRNHIAMDEADREDALVVAVTRDGSVFLGRTKITPSLVPTLAGVAVVPRFGVPPPFVSRSAQYPQAVSISP